MFLVLNYFFLLEGLKETETQENISENKREYIKCYQKSRDKLLLVTLSSS